MDLLKNLDNMITAEELLNRCVEEKGINYDNWIKQVPPIVFAFAIEFAKLHVTEALKNAEVAVYENIQGHDWDIPNNIIIESYPLDNIE